MLFVTKSWMPIWSGLKVFWGAFLLPFSWRLGFLVVGGCDEDVVVVVSWFIFDRVLGWVLGVNEGCIDVVLVVYVSFLFYMQLFLQLHGVSGYILLVSSG